MSESKETLMSAQGWAARIRLYDADTDVLLETFYEELLFWVCSEARIVDAIAMVKDVYPENKPMALGREFADRLWKDLNVSPDMETENVEFLYKVDYVKWSFVLAQREPYVAPR